VGGAQTGVASRQVGSVLVNSLDMALAGHDQLKRHDQLLQKLVPGIVDHELIMSAILAQMPRGEAAVAETSKVEAKDKEACACALWWLLFRRGVGRLLVETLLTGVRGRP
jgi:hypothetical protein